MIGSAVVGGQRRPVGQTGEHHPRSHDPSHVGRPHHVFAADLGMEGALGGELHGETGLDVDGSLGRPVVPDV